MLKFTFGAFAALVILGLFIKEPIPNYEAMLDKTVRISVDNPLTSDPEDTKGTGFISDSGYIITAAHVVTIENPKITALTRSGDILGLEIVKIIPEKDIIILKTSNLGAKRAKLSCQPLRLGQKIIAIGGPTFLDWIITQGTVAGLRRTGLGELQGLDVYITDLSLGPGMSGGPVFNVYGDVVGMNEAILNASNGPFNSSLLGISVITSGEAICEELKKLPKI